MAVGSGSSNILSGWATPKSTDSAPPRNDD